MRADVLVGPSPWFIDRLGFTAARDLWTAIPEALSAAVTRAAAHGMSRTSADHTFGNPRWSLPYEYLATRLRHVAGTTVARTSRAPYQLPLVGDQVLLPWWYGPTAAVAMRDAPPGRSFGRLARELLRRFGPARPSAGQPAPPGPPLLRDEIDERDVAQVCAAVGRLTPSPRVLIVGYACTGDHGLLRACVGEATLGAGGLDWRRTDDLPLPVPAIPRPRLMRFP